MNEMVEDTAAFVTDNGERVHVCVASPNFCLDGVLNAGPAQLAQKLEEEGRTGANARETKDVISRETMRLL